MSQVIDYLLYFFIYSAIGFILEVVLCSIRDKKLVNRGFLFGPILPVYGFGVLVVLLSTQNVKDSATLTFLVAMFACSALEYFTSWLMEKFYGIKLWDYSKSDRYNLNGRICLRNGLAFGIVGCFAVRNVQPRIAAFVSRLGSLKPPIVIALIALFLLDLVASTYAVQKVKHSIRLKLISGDQTSEVKKLASGAIAQLLTGKNYLERRIEKLKRDYFH
ncbi:putative ABC transporter permease [Candidatus Saccharibacteria bacterium]|nr:putative ABC transporter permease [Candidatus Saccharibacteria bacterium]